MLLIAIGLPCHPVAVPDALEFTAFKLQHRHELTVTGVVRPFFDFFAAVKNNGSARDQAAVNRFAKTVFQHRLPALLQNRAFGIAQLGKVAFAIEVLRVQLGVQTTPHR